MNIIDVGLEFGSNMSLRNVNSIKRIILHHSGVTVLQSVETIHNYHKNTNGWAGIGYHFYIRKDGTVYKGRPLECVGAHASGNNSDSIGICCEGNFEVEQMPEAQENSLVELIRYLLATYPQIIIIQGHKDVNSTSCPGANFPLNVMKNLILEDEIKEDTNNDLYNDGLVNCVYDIQEWLNRKYNTNLALDNIYGEETKKALIKGLQTELNVQFNKGLAIDGIFGTNTYNACINVRIGAGGNITMLIQMCLFIKGYNVSMDKKFGQDTLSKVKQFQNDNGLSVDGIVGKNTFKALFN